MNNFLIIGFGLIGKERLSSLLSINCKNDKFSCDIYDPEIDEDFFNNPSNKKYKITCIHDFEIVKNKNYDLVIISTPHHLTAEYVKYFLKKDITILVEKPLGRSVNELKNIIKNKKNSKIHIGFNYPYFKCIEELKKDIKRNIFGEIASIDLRIGHGNYPNAKESWKLNKELCGGGVLLDPGIHMIDLLLHFFSEDINVISAVSWSGFWNTGIEEEAKVILKVKKTLITLDLSSIKWRSKFEIDVNGTDAYARIHGRGRSYGKQIYTYGEKWSWQNGKSQNENEIIKEETDCSESFKKELKDIVDGRKSNLESTFKGMLIYEEIKDKIM